MLLCLFKNFSIIKSTKGLNESSKPFGNGTDPNIEDMLDIVGRGYNDRPIRQLRADPETSPYGLEAPARAQPEVSLLSNPQVFF
jgi:hypothetical protein